ncbi:MAG: hypothetical protein JWM32_113 [Verrucomicrobia bacterium]|nr:hypothetical protein [Verrucomicrobiota bacterium]
MHARFSPRRHHFLYRIFMFALDLDELEALDRRFALFSVNRRNFYSFRERDFFPTGEPIHNGKDEPSPPVGGAGQLKARLTAFLAERGVDLTGGRVMLVTLPRVLGYLFNPVSFYFCYDRAGTPVAALSEVTNTFKEMKPYFLGPATRTGDAGFHLRTPKHFYVSPFADVDVAFDFNLRPPTETLDIRIDDYVGTERTLTSTLAGPRRELTGARLAWYALKYPLITLKVIALIHWHALLLWRKRVPWFAKAARRAEQRELYRPHISITHTPDAA